MMVWSDSTESTNSTDLTDRCRTLKAISGWDVIGLDGMVILYTVTPRASLQSDAKNSLATMMRCIAAD